MATSAQDEFNELMRNKERRTAHPEDADSDARSFLNLSDDDNDRTPPASNYDPDENLPRSSTSTARNIIPRTRYGANTGPKGVISDAQHFRDSQRNHRTSLRSLIGAQAPVVEEPPSRHWTQEPTSLEKLEEGDDGLDDDDADEGFVSRWRQGRLKELQNGDYESGINKSGKNRRSYGGLTTVDGEGYLDAVEKSGPQTVVVVYIYDDMVSLGSISRVLDTLLTTWLVTCFSDDRRLRAHAGKKAQQRSLCQIALPRR
jgi:hypothetical protein